jgi:Phosphoesterase family
LGGRTRRSDDSSVEVSFENAQNMVLSTASLAPVTSQNRSNVTELLSRSTKGSVPAGATSALVDLRLTTTAKDYNGPNGSTVGFNYAYADDVSLSLSVPVVASPALRPPAAAIPHFDHVFLIYLENQDYKQIIGNTKEAPFVNSLLSKSTLLSNIFAEEHPSDGNYLSFAGGSEFDAPADDPAEENSQYTIDAKNIGDLVDSAHESWKVYLQSAAGPCDNTVHDYYWDDDLPMMYFKDVRDRPGYCDAHVVPLNQYSIDLKKASTTPNFAWIGANDCDDMEGCGIKAGDSFLKTVATEFFDSPAWKTQPSLFIITWDEDDQDYQHPAQRVPTIVIGSQYVKKGFVSTVRYTHYSLLRTTEAALGLGTLTKNDEYATPLNDVFGGSK